MNENDLAIPFTEDDVKKYLDDMIDAWRENGKEATGKETKLIASCYIDAYQSVRKNLFGELKE